jgi:sugar O-acyltransferase (sialic acid O-acetyltransferase NeuD family)
LKRKLAIIGGGELGRQILNLSLSTNLFNVIGFFDDTLDVGSVPVPGHEVIGGTNDVLSNFASDNFDCLFIAIGYAHMKERKSFYEKYAEKIPLATIIHNSCVIDPSARIGKGVVLYPGCIIDKNVVIADNVLLNLGAVIAHDTYIGPHCFVAPRVAISGFVKVNESCFLGTGAIIVDNISVSQNAIIGAGTLVNKNIGEEGVFVGNPARKLIKKSR